MIPVTQPQYHQDNWLDASRIAPKLWQGTYPPEGKHMRQLGFDVVILCAAEYQLRPERLVGVEVIHAPNYDGGQPCCDEGFAYALTAAERAARRIEVGKRVYSSCQAGLVRSGLVSALILKKLYPQEPIEKIVAHVRAMRQNALCNEHFVSRLKREFP